MKIETEVWIPKGCKNTEGVVVTPDEGMLAKAVQSWNGDIEAKIDGVVHILPPWAGEPKPVIVECILRERDPYDYDELKACVMDSDDLKTSLALAIKDKEYDLNMDECLIQACRLFNFLDKLYEQHE